MLWILATLFVIGAVGPFVMKALMFEMLLTVIMVGYAVIAFGSGQVGIVATLLAAFGYAAVVQVGFVCGLGAMALVAHHHVAADKAAGKMSEQLKSKPKSTAFRD